MRALRLDYHASSVSSAPGKILLGLGLALLALTAFQYDSLEQELAAEELRTDEIRKAAKRDTRAVRVNARDAEASARELELAQRAVQRLSLRWDQLFGALEGVRVDGVALLAIEPDAGKSLVKLTAEAKSAEDMLEYVNRLQGASGLADVRLASHQVKANDPLKPMRFVVLASWVK